MKNDLLVFYYKEKKKEREIVKWKDYIYIFV